MAGRIPQNFIDELLNRVDIVDVIDSRVALKKRGKEYIACCPFHGEKTPSFTVSQSKQFYHCFGCGAHGTAISFIMEYERLEFVDAIEALAEEYHLEVPREESQRPDRSHEKNAIYDVLQQASQLYQKQLKASPRAIDYLKGRGLSGDIARTFQLGYAPDEWDFILAPLGKTPEQRKVLLQAGLIIEKSPDKHYDRFRDRIMFPIRDRRGRVIGFGGRILDKGEPKYLNSPETPVFHKGQELYGLFEARQAVRDLSRIVIVEGYMDVVALAQHGIPYAVATLGTATSEEQVSRLFRIVPEIIFCFDGDRAGHQAAWRALEHTLPVLRDGVQARFLFLPDGEDPDSLVRKEGQQAFEQRLSRATPLSDYLLDSLGKQVDMTSMDGRARLSELAKPLLSKLSEGVFKELLVQRLEHTIGLGNATLRQHIPVNPTAAPQHNRPPLQERDHRHQIKVTPIRQAIALLLQYPELARKVTLAEGLATSGLPGLDLLLAVHRVIVQTDTTSPSALLERWRDTPEADILTRLMQLEIPDSDQETLRLCLFEDALDKLGRLHRDQRLETLLNKSQNEGLSADEKQELRQLSSSRH